MGKMFERTTHAAFSSGNDKRGVQKSIAKLLLGNYKDITKLLPGNYKKKKIQYTTTSKPSHFTFRRSIS